MFSSVQVRVKQILEIFLFAGAEGGFAELAEDESVQVAEINPALLDVAAVARVEARVALLEELRELPVRLDPAGDPEGEGVGIHPADMGVEEIRRIDRGPPELRI